jgi:hypothetical protein
MYVYILCFVETLLAPSLFIWVIKQSDLRKLEKREDRNKREKVSKRRRVRKESNYKERARERKIDAEKEKYDKK